MKKFRGQARKAQGRPLRRLTAVCAILALASVVALAGSASADIGDGILGGTPTATKSSTVCPAGTAVTAVNGNVDIFGTVGAVTADCSGGATAVGTIGDLSSGATLSGSACGAGEIAVGIVGREWSVGIAQLSLRCRASDLSGAVTTAASTLGGTGGDADGPYDCPDGQLLTGLTGSVTGVNGFHAEEVEIQCGSPSTPTIVMSGDAPDGTVGVPYSFTYSASGDSGITFSATGALPPGLSLDPATGTLSGSPTTAGGYMFTITASGTSGASKTLDDAIVISPAPPPIIILSSTGVSFGDQLVGSSSAAHTVTIDNALFSSQPLVLGSLSVAGANSADFSLGNDTCSGKSLAPNASCTVDVVFTPTQVGSRTASLNIPSNAASSPDSVTLTGNGTAPPAADVRLRITGPTSALTGTQNTYVMNIANAGPAKAVGVTMNVQVPSGTKFVAVSTTQGSCTYPASGATPGTIRCALGDLASGAAALDTVTLKLALTGKGGSIALVGQAASSSTPDPDLSNNVASPTTTLKKK